MADAGVSEAALLGAAATAAAEASAAGGTAAALAATVPELFGGAAALGGTAAAAAPVVAEAAIPTLALATPAVEAATTAAPIAAAATEVPAVSAPSAGLLATGSEAPIFLGATETEAAPATGLLGSVSSTGPETTGVYATPSGVSVGTEAFGPPTSEWGVLADKLGNWWETSSLGDKLSVGGKALGGISAAQKVLAPTMGASGSGSKTTIRPGTTGQPRGGEQALAQVVENLLKRTDLYRNAQYGTPVSYRPRSLLG